MNIEFDEGYLSDLFKVPNEGFKKYFKGTYNLKIGQVPKEEIMAFVGGNKGSTRVNHHYFTPLKKMLFIIVWRVVFPRTKKRDEANLLDVMLRTVWRRKSKLIFQHL